MTIKAFCQRIGLAAFAAVAIATPPLANLGAQENPMFFKPWRPMGRASGKWPLVLKPGVRIKRNGPDVYWTLIHDFGDSFVARTLPRKETDGGSAFLFYWLSIKPGDSTVHHKNYVLEFYYCSVYPADALKFDDSTMETFWRDLQKPDRRCSFSENGPRFEQSRWNRMTFTRDEPRER